jgi:ubiquinone/menaquinone biosynthesis C-methylase UbiE
MKTLETQGVQEKYNSEDRTKYEEGRWTSSPVARAGFTLTMEAIQRSLLPYIKDVKEYLELGPGPGTWTKVIRPSIPSSSMHLVDISSAMLASAKKNIGEDPAFTFTESDFLKWSPTKEYDLFFSSRAIEYFPDKRPPVATIAKALRKGGEAFLITKLPHYGRMRFLGKKAGAFHEGMVTPEALETHFREAEMDVIDVRPVFVVVPGLHSATLDLLATRVLRLFPWNPLTASITESYLIRAKKR